MQVRRLAVGLAFAIATVAVSGCNTSTLSKQEMVVDFNPDAPQSDHVAALNACSHVAPDIVAEPMVPSNLPSNNVSNVRFRIDHADDHDQALLTECLNKQPGVIGEHIPDLTD